LVRTITRSVSPVSVMSSMACPSIRASDGTSAFVEVGPGGLLGALMEPLFEGLSFTQRQALLAGDFSDPQLYALDQLSWLDYLRDRAGASPAALEIFGAWLGLRMPWQWSMAAILRDELGKGAFPGVLHCFTASAELARIGLDLGLYISISGIVTFKSAQTLQTIARDLPQERLLIETDAPFLAPVPHRGKTGEPGFVADTAAFLAKLRGENVEELSRRTAENFHTLFGKTRVSGAAA
jgi:hypothetical protein